MFFELKVALRFLKEGKGQSLFILIGISVGVSVMIFLNTLITGLQDDLVNQTVGSSAHVWITCESKFQQESDSLNERNIIVGNTDSRAVLLSEWENMIRILELRDDLRGISPLVEGSAFYIDKGESTPVQIKGFDIKSADEIYQISKKVVDGVSTYNGNNILVGTDFSDKYKVGVGDVVKFNLPTGGNQTFVINGIFDLGNGIANGSWIIMELQKAQKLFGLGNDITKIEMQIKEIFDAVTINESIQSRLTGVKVDNWIENNSSLLTALQSQSSSSILIQVFVLLAVTLGIASVLGMSAVQKSKQLGILKAMGTKARQASRIFILQGAMLGFTGACLGALLGIGIIELFLWGTAIQTGVPLFPLSVEFASTAFIVGISTLSSTIAAFIPANRSSKLNPVEVIRNG